MPPEENVPHAKGDETTRKSYTVIIATALTVAWAIAAGWIFSNAAMCVSPGTGNFIADRFLCLPANAIGDMLAGAFAPLAFLWLTAAVILQRNELAAQRQELRESREVARQQVQEARNNVLLIQTQTKMLEEDNQRRIQRECDEDISELVSILAVELATWLNDYAVGDSSTDKITFDDHANMLSISTHHVPEDAFVQCQRYLHDILMMSDGVMMWVASRKSVFYRSVHPLQQVLGTMGSIGELVEGASRPMRAKLRLHGLNQCYRETSGLIENILTHGTELEIADIPF